ncbi:MAG: hypothetical protein E7435_05370 [Ruminococcaceae bacterium]|nr:hypothetical protein [Oscillospiraceae bacterium]
MEMSKKISSIVKIAALAIIVVFFIPSFCVSCGGAEVEVEFSAFDAAIGIVDDKAYEVIGSTPSEDSAEEIEASPLLFVIVILAVVIFKYTNTRSLISIVSAIGCAVTMLLMKQGVEDYIHDSESAMFVLDMETTFAYSLHMILSIGIIALLLFERFILDHPERKEQVGNIASQVSNTASNVWQEVKRLDKPPVENDSRRIDNTQENNENKSESYDAHKVIVQKKEKPISANNNDIYMGKVGAEEKVCPNCGVVQNIENKVCWFCRQRFED